MEKQTNNIINLKKREQSWSSRLKNLLILIILDSTYGGDVTRDGNISEYFTPRGMDKAVADFNWSAVFNQASFASGNPFAFFFFGILNFWRTQVF